MILAYQEGALLLLTPWRGVHAYWWGNLRGPNLLDTFERLHSEPCWPFLEVGQEADHLGRKGKSRLTVKVYNSTECKTGISAMLMITSGLGTLTEYMMNTNDTDDKDAH